MNMMKKEMEDVVKYSDQVDGRGESQYVCKPCDKRTKYCCTTVLHHMSGVSMCGM